MRFGVLALVLGACGAGGARPVPAHPVDPAQPEPHAGASAIVISSPVGAVAASCSRYADIGGYALPAWVLGGGASAPGPSSAELRARVHELPPRDPERAQVLWALGQRLLRDGDEAVTPEARLRARADAIRALAVLIEEFPAHLEMDTVLFRMATALARIDQPDRARQVYFRLVRNHPSSRWVAPSYLAFGDHYFEQGDMAAAEQFYRKVLELPAADVHAYALYRAAAALARLEDVAGARARFAELERYLSSTPDVPDRDAMRAAVQRDICGLP